MIVKALWEHGSLGLDKTSVMRCEEAQQVLIARTLSHKTEHFAEVYIDGREFNLSLLEHSSGVEVLPIAEILFEGLEANAPKIVDFDAKWTMQASFSLWPAASRKPCSPVASLLRDRFLMLIATGSGDFDWSALAALAARDAGEPSPLFAAKCQGP